ncbi:MAG: hypothetical protein ACUVQK_05670 [Thermogutta sp.]
MRSIFLLLAIGVAVGLLNGCGSGDTRNLPATVTATGYVYLDGKPVKGAAVVFIPENINTGYPAQAISNAQGYFELQAFDKKKGAVPGNYVVQVAKTVEVAMEGAQVQGESEDFRAVTYKNELPAKYANIATSDLKQTIPDSGIKDIRLDLRSQPER